MSSNEIVRISSEWLDANKSRAYPFDDACADAPNRIPSPVFTDAFFQTSGVGSGGIFVNRVVLGQTSFQIYIASSDRDIGLLADIPYTTEERTQIPVDIMLDDGATISGVLVVGDVTEIKNMQSDSVLTEAAGKFFLGCVREISDNRLLGIKVNDKLYTGVIDLVAGDGIELAVEELEEETKITVSAKDRSVPPENMIITDDATLLKEISKLYGTPVAMINGVKPDAQGNITLAYPTAESGGKGYTPFPSATGTIILQDASGASETCENTLIETIMANIAELNNRSARHAETLDALDTANNVMSISLSRLS